VAARADSLARFGRELADWLHTVRTLGSRSALARTLETAPRRLSGVFPEGALADATLAAYAEWLSACIRNTPPDFKRRNLFTSVPDLPVRLRRGRPPVPAVTKRATNAARQRRFQQNRRELLRELLRELAGARRLRTKSSK
jgi:hypothetical protein